MIEANQYTNPAETTENNTDNTLELLNFPT